MASIENLGSSSTSPDPAQIWKERLRQAMGLLRFVWWEWDVRSGVIITHPLDVCVLGYEVGGDQCVAGNVTLWLERTHPLDLEEVERALAGVLNGENSRFKCIQRMREKDGSWTWVTNAGNVVLTDGDGLPLKLHGVLQAADDWAGEQTQFRMLESTLSEAYDGWAFIDDEQRIRFWDEGCSRLLKVANHPVMGCRLDDLFIGLDLSRLQRSLQDAKHQKFVVLEWQTQAATGERAVTEVKIFRHHDIKMDTVGWVLTCVDITLKVKEREHLVDLHIALSQGGFLFAVVDIEGRLTSVNQAMARMLGSRKEELEGQVFSDYVHGVSHLDKPQFNVVTWRGQLKTKGNQEGEWQISIAIVPVSHVGGMPDRWVIFGEDSTHAMRSQRRESLFENRISELQKTEDLALVAAGIAHDFNNLVTVISTTIEIIQESTDESRRKRAFDQILRTTFRMRDLLQRMMMFSRRSEPEFELLDLRKVVGSASNLLRTVLPPGVEIEEPAVAEPIWVRGAPIQLEQAILNLGINAGQAMSSGNGRIIIAISTDEESDKQGPDVGVVSGDSLVCVSVTDDGSGIAEELLMRAFEPFFSSKMDTGGMGLGLPTARTIMLAHNGGMTLRSQVNRGTVVKLYLPRSASPVHVPTPTLAVKTELPNLANRQIVIVDDEPDVAMAMRDMIAITGADVVMFNSPFDFLLWMKGGGLPNLMVLDLVMPGLTGLEVLEEVGKTHPLISCIIVSGTPNHPSLARLPKRNNFELLPKPFVRFELLEAVLRILGLEER